MVGCRGDQAKRLKELEAENAKRKSEGLKVSQKQKPRGRLWLKDGSCVGLRPTHKNHVWSYDFVSVRTHHGRTARARNLIDEHTREALVVRVERRWSSAKVIEALADVMVVKPRCV
jgi:putative transposase